MPIISHRDSAMRPEQERLLPVRRYPDYPVFIPYQPFLMKPADDAAKAVPVIRKPGGEFVFGKRFTFEEKAEDFTANLPVRAGKPALFLYLTREASVRLFEHHAVIEQGKAPDSRGGGIEGLFDNRHHLLISNLFPVPKEKPVVDGTDIGINKRRREVESDGSNGSGSIIAHPGQGTQHDRIRRDTPAKPGEDFPSGFPKEHSTAVITQPLPDTKHINERRFGEGTHVWEGGEEFPVFADNTGRLRLLKHHFRDEEVIGVIRFPPGETATVLTVVPKDFVPECLNHAGIETFFFIPGENVKHSYGSYRPAVCEATLASGSNSLLSYVETGSICPQ